jgi:hypothetical protein
LPKGLDFTVKKLTEYVLTRLIAGVLVVAPIYLATLLLLKAMKSIAGLAKPFTHLVPAWLPADQLLSLLLVLVSCFFIGLAVRTPVGRAARERLENSLFQRLPGYALIRSLTQRLVGETRDQAWKPALAEIEEALVPAFVIEELLKGLEATLIPTGTRLSAVKANAPIALVPALRSNCAAAFSRTPASTSMKLMKFMVLIR